MCELLRRILFMTGVLHLAQFRVDVGQKFMSIWRFWLQANSLLQEWQCGIRSALHPEQSSKKQISAIVVRIEPQGLTETRLRLFCPSQFVKSHSQVEMEIIRIR